ncbi:MAG: hypothetical protein QOJ81_678 [Chloroflexota bacterium]|jgi:hypothetical protein|nr:hypothetical protein [Chloroflexota bacterium]
MFDSPDYIYMPSRDVAADLEWFVETLGAKVVFAIDGMGARVAMLKMGRSKPPLLLADHVAGDAPVLVYRVADLDEARRELRQNGWKKGRMLELPMGTALSFKAPGGQRIALFELSRPDVERHFRGRRDF